MSNNYKLTGCLLKQLSVIRVQAGAMEAPSLDFGFNSFFSSQGQIQDGGKLFL